MKRLLLPILFLLLAGQAWGGGAQWSDRRWTGGVWWQNGLTFWAPLDDPSNPLKINKSAAGTTALTFTRATTATYVHPTTGLITSAASGGLRIESNGALIEGQRTNLALYSEQLGLAATWIASNVTVDNNTAVAPDGNTTAETLTATADNATLLQAVTGTAAAYTNSLYLKRKTGTGAVSVSADNTTWTACTINASTWTRCTDTRTLTVATYYYGVRLATNADAVYAWGGGMELGAFGSSYISTTTAAITRNADVLTFPIAGNVSDNQITVAFQPTRNNVPTGVSTSLVAGVVIGDYTSDASLLLGSISNGTIVGLGSFPAVWSLILWYSTSPPIGTPYKDAYRMASDGANFSIVRNGGSAQSNVANPVKTSAWFGNNVTIGSTSGGTDVDQSINIKDIRIWNRALTDAEMVSITQ